MSEHNRLKEWCRARNIDIKRSIDLYFKYKNWNKREIFKLESLSNYKGNNRYFVYIVQQDLIKDYFAYCIKKKKQLPFIGRKYGGNKVRLFPEDFKLLK